jgi:hypothetical protein
MTLHFTGTVDGDALSGQANPGVFPPSPFTAHRG